MARERGQADKEAGTSMRKLGFNAVKSRDALRCMHCGKLMFPQSKAGVFDFPNVYIPLDRADVRYVDVEVKAGSSSFAFSEFSDDQRAWADEDNEHEKWLWICIGKAIRSKKHPRKTWLIPLQVFYDLEVSIGRKSIPYECHSLDMYELTWLGGGVWDIPGCHPFWRE